MQRKCNGRSRSVNTNLANSEKSVHCLETTSGDICKSLNGFEFNQVIPNPYLVCDKEVETSIIKKAIGHTSFKFGDVHFFDIRKFLAGWRIISGQFPKSLQS